MPKIVHERSKCIGCGACIASCPKFWSMGEDGLAKLNDSTTNPATKNDELIVEKVGCIQEAADGCPVQIIHVIDKSENKPVENNPA